MADNDSSQTLQEAVNTGTDNRVRRRPFTVILNCPQRWDPGAGPLEVSYEVYDPNVRVRRGRLRYVVMVDGTETTLFTMDLESSRLRPGCYELTQGQRWDGTIRTGIDARIGQRITADLSNLYVYVEVWNTESSQPGQSTGDDGRTNVQGEWKMEDVKDVEIDAIAEARWDRNWVIPDKNPDEPDKGRVSVTIEVKNVAEGTPVQLEVLRIGEPSDPLSDFIYVDNSDTYEDDQLGMKGAVVRNGRVVVGEGNAKPVVVFNQFSEHWLHPGNNFYALRIGFGAGGDMMLATERDYDHHEDRCLHMRFTVFIHNAALNCGYLMRAGRQLHDFFRRKTKYWRSYLLVDGPRSREDLFAHYEHQFIVVVNAHGGCWCKFENHPTYPKGRGSSRQELYKRLPRDGFLPDQNVCPTDVSSRRTGGCGEKNWVGHGIVLGRSPNQASLGSMRRKKFITGSIPGRTERDMLGLIVEDNNNESGRFYTSQFVPKFAFYSNSCRSMLTTNLGEVFLAEGTKYFHGWTYSVLEVPAADMTVDLFTKWIKGTRADPASTEFDLNKFPDVYKKEAARTRGRRRYYPRIMDGSGVLNSSNRASPSSTAEALQ